MRRSALGRLIGIVTTRSYSREILIRFRSNEPLSWTTGKVDPGANFSSHIHVAPGSECRSSCRSPCKVRLADESFKRAFYAGTTSVEAADEEGWVVSVTPSGGWVPAVIARSQRHGLSQRAQSFVTDPADGPFNVIEPGKHPRVTLTPTLAMKDGKPFLAFAVQGSDSQDQNLLQFS